MPESTVTHRTGIAAPPTVSIGMPVYNGEKYIREALDSLLSQSYTDFELIISDNASTDGTEAICRQYAAKDLRIRYVRQPENRGAWANFQYVLDEAKGQYFMWAAADDVWSAQWVQRLLETIQHTQAKAAFGRVQVVNEHLEKIKHPVNETIYEYRDTPLFRRLRYYVQAERLWKANPIYGLFESEILKEVSLTKYKYDFVVVFDLLNKTDIAACKDQIMYKRDHPDSASRTAERQITGNENKNFFRRLIAVIKYLSNPFPFGLINEYIQHTGNNKLLFVALTPIKYLLVYWDFSRHVYNKHLKSRVWRSAPTRT